jgi:AAA15 family ATPase/GTPase
MGETHISIEKSGKGFMPLSLFGDALNRIVQIILTIVNNRGSVILIDEVENGIHHTAQRDFWTYLFKIAKEFDVQVFATTHSLEMINAFSEVAGKDFVEDAAYFELVRHLKTGEIVGIKHKIDTLEYEIIKKLKFRGEPTA